ncbi:MAG: HAMP domain-containing histidine kinase [Sphingobacteriales bacterium]|nr:HAMP domain-containing histidine kinase [Sphingobacteriales bacterium]
MNIYRQEFYWRIGLLIFALFIVIASLIYNNQLANKLSQEERKKVEMIGTVYSKIIQANENTDLSFEFAFIQNNTTVPLIITDQQGNVLREFTRNLDEKKIEDDAYLVKELRSMKKAYEPVTIALDSNTHQYLYYKDSELLSQLRIYPYVQLGIITLFLVVTYFAFMSAKRAEQNQVWVGMARETAHQIGTPLSSLSAWTDVLAESDERGTRDIAAEISNDVSRLELIAERFSKIGSKPKMEITLLNTSLLKTFRYMERRAPQKVRMTNNLTQISDIQVPASAPLLDWVLENLLKNALDAMESGEGSISVTLSETDQHAVIDVKDSGKGISKSEFERVFKPGYSSKKRGWGLGLSLSKRIIEEYHDGKIFVHQSALGKGTSFRILLPKQVSA